MIKAVLFDLDNTLIDFMKMKRLCCEAAVDAMINSGLKMQKKKALKVLYGIYREVGIEDDTVFQKFLGKVNKKVDYRILSNAIVAYRKVRYGVLEPYPFVWETLLKLREKGLKLAVVSDAPRLKCWIRLASMNLDDFFDVVVAYEDTRSYKPSSLPFKKALKKIGCRPEEALMVGDNLKRDIIGAKQLGIKTVFAKYGYSPVICGKSNGKIPDYQVDSIKSLLKIVEKANKE